MLWIWLEAFRVLPFLGKYSPANVDISKVEIADGGFFIHSVILLPNTDLVCLFLKILFLPLELNP